MKKAAVVLAVLTLALAAAASWAQARWYEVPILMYHRVDLPTSEKRDSTLVSPSIFERQMEFLKVHNYRVIGLEQLAAELRAGKKIAPKTVVITFDDGTLDNFRFAFPVLKKMGFPAVIFMITRNIGQEGWLSEEDLRILDESGIAIGSHTVSHSFLPDEKPENIPGELSASKARLEALLGHPVTLFSYPAGGVTPAIARQVEEAGYTAAVTTNYGRERHNLMALHRIKATESGGSLFSFWVKTSGFYHLGKKRSIRA